MIRNSRNTLCRPRRTERSGIRACHWKSCRTRTARVWFRSFRTGSRSQVMRRETSNDNREDSYKAAIRTRSSRCSRQAENSLSSGKSQTASPYRESLRLERWRNPLLSLNRVRRHPAEVRLLPHLESPNLAKRDHRAAQPAHIPPSPKGSATPRSSSFSRDLLRV